MKQQIQQQQPRQTAYIVQINDLVNSSFVKEEGWNPNYVVIGNKNVSRVNIIGTVIDKREEENMQNIIVDDGTGKIAVRNFEGKSDVGIGDVVLVVGRVRQFGSEMYINPEVVRKGIDKKWNLLWKKCALKNYEKNTNQIKDDKEKAIKQSEDIKDRIDKIISKVRELDNGDGASYEEIIKAFPDEDAISGLLMRGDLFEIKPGRLKVLD